MSERLHNIQILRGFAACMVLMSHVGTELGPMAAARGLDLRLNWSVWASGVDIFFVLSGFVMVLTAGADFGRKGAAGAFLLRRIARIAPLYWLLTTALVLGALLAPALLRTPIGDASHVLASYLFWPSMRGDEIRPVLALGWTLQYEMFFYALFALSMLLPRTLGLSVLAAVIASLILAGQGGWMTGTALSFWSSPIMLEFLLGVLLALAYRDGLRIGSALSSVLVIGGLALLLTSGAAVEDRSNIDSLVRLAFPALLVVAGAALGPQAGDGRLTRFGVALGEASFSLYLFHPFVLRPLHALWDKMDAPIAAFAPAAVMLSFAASFALYRWIETPMTGAAQRLLARRRPTPTLQPAE